MEGGAGVYNPRTVEEVFRDFKGRRAAIVKALTSGISLNFYLIFFSGFNIVFGSVCMMFSSPI